MNKTNNELTDSNFWDIKWKNRRLGNLRARHPLFGKNGIFMRVFREIIPEIEGKTVLELGGANSRFLLALAKWGRANVTAIDYSPVGLENTRSLFKKNDCSLRAIEGDFLQWKSSEQFDVVVHWGVIEHFKDPEPIMEKCWDLLKPGGKLIFSMPNMDAWGTYFWKKWAPSNWEKHIYHPETLISKIGYKSGFEKEKTFYWGFPLLRFCRWEKNGIFPLLITGAQVGLNLIEYLIPVYHQGSQNISGHIGFVFKK